MSDTPLNAPNANNIVVLNVEDYIPENPDKPFFIPLPGGERAWFKIPEDWTDEKAFTEKTLNYVLGIKAKIEENPSHKYKDFFPMDDLDAAASAYAIHKMSIHPPEDLLELEENKIDSNGDEITHLSKIDMLTALRMLKAPKLVEWITFHVRSKQKSVDIMFAAKEIERRKKLSGETQEDI